MEDASGQQLSISRQTTDLSHFSTQGDFSPPTPAGFLASDATSFAHFTQLTNGHWLAEESTEMMSTVASSYFTWLYTLCRLVAAGL